MDGYLTEIDKLLDETSDESRNCFSWVNICYKKFLEYSGMIYQTEISSETISVIESKIISHYYDYARNKAAAYSPLKISSVFELMSALFA